MNRKFKWDTLSIYFTLKALKGKLYMESANKIDPDEMAHNEPPHLDLPCLPSNLWILSMIWYGQNFFVEIRRCKFCCLLTPF